MKTEDGVSVKDRKWRELLGRDIWKMRVEKRGWEKTCPEEAGESQEGLNAPVASGREPAGTTEGGDKPSPSLPDAG